MKDKVDTGHFLNHLKIFIAIADTANVSKAAASLYIKQSTMSAQLKKLESMLGFKVFDRIGRSVVLNARGAIFYDYAKEVIDKYDTVIDKINGKIELPESLIIHAGIYFNEYFLPQILPVFKKENHFINIEFLTGYSDAIIADIENKKYDLAIVASSHSLKVPNMQIDFSYDIPIYFVCSPQNPLAEKTVLFPEDIKEETVILVPQGNNMHEYLRHNFKKHGISFAHELYVSSIDAIKSSTKNNLGVAFMPQHVVQNELDRNELKHIDIEGVELVRKMFCIHHIEKPLSMTALDFIEATTQVLDEEKHFKRIAN